MKDRPHSWTIADAMSTYGVEHWGKGYFGINDKGHATVLPNLDPNEQIDLKLLVDALKTRGIEPPVLLRFSDLLRHRIGEIHDAFAKAIKENDYQGDYRCVYPIKVNQQRHVVEEVHAFGGEYGFGLEAGSKPELLAVLAMVDDPDTPVICNGFKDDVFIELVILAQKMGRNVIPVVEKFSELMLIVKHAQMHGVMPRLGIRAKLSSRGAGRWETSGGARSKFGLFISEVLDALQLLDEHGWAEGLKLLHFHLGSQVTHIHNLKDAINELTRIYVQLKRMGAGLEYLDIGGGLGVDYDGSQTAYESSMNYTLAEYASDTIFRIKSICDEAEVAHPTVISESGRAMVAHHSILIFDALGVSTFDQFELPDELPTDESGEIPQPLKDLHMCVKDIHARNCREYYHDAVSAYEQSLNLFKLGYMTLEQRAVAERLYWATNLKTLKLTRKMNYVPEELQDLQSLISDTYYCNFSLFQSLPDSWAIRHNFPIMPIHRLNQRPRRRGVLADITCDSDGKIDHFTALRDDKDTLELHDPDDRPYHLGVFLVGAYQEILGDLHNLLGDTHAVHVKLNDLGEPEIEHVVWGDTAKEVLHYVQYKPEDMLEHMRRSTERAVRSQSITLSESTQFLKMFHAALEDYTYMQPPGSPHLSSVASGRRTHNGETLDLGSAIDPVDADSPETPVSP